MIIYFKEEEEEEADLKEQEVGGKVVKLNSLKSSKNGINLSIGVWENMSQGKNIFIIIKGCRLEVARRQQIEINWTNFSIISFDRRGSV